MEFLFGLIGLALLTVPIIVIWLAFSHVALRRKVETLSAELGMLRSKGSTAKADVSTAEQTPTKSVAPPSSLTQTPPHAAKSPEPDKIPPSDTPPKSYVFAAENTARLAAWIKENWFIAIAALSLAMAGIFLVQYGIEKGILSPTNRVLCALLFGAALIASGEWIRRRSDDETGTAAFLPSAFAGAGVVTLFAAILSAQQMYGLIGKETAFLGLIGLAVLSLVLGWLYGPFLTVIGLIGAVVAPFIVSDGTSENTTWLFYYFALIAAVGLGVDAMKRSAWVSALGLILPYIGATLIWMVSGSEHFVVFAALIALAAICIPTVQIRPAFTGASSFQWIHTLGKSGWPEFPTRLAASGVLALAVVAVPVSMGGEIGFWLTLVILAGTLFLLGYWWNRTEVLDDLAVPVTLSILAIINLQGLFNLDVAAGFAAPLNLDLGETTPRTMTWLVAFGLGISALAGWRSLRDPRNDLSWAAGAAMFAPAVVISLALFWEPLTHLTTVQWASHVIGVAVMMTVFAEQSLRSTIHKATERSGQIRTSMFALAALNMIAFAMSIVLTETALTLGFAGVVASGAWLDRKFNIRPVSWFVQLGIITCSYRLVIDPGLPWAVDASLFELFIGYLGTIALIGIAWWMLQKRERTGAMIVAESAAFSLGSIFLSVLLFRIFDESNPALHWSYSVFGLVWLIASATEFYRVRAEGPLKTARMALGMIFGTIGILLLLITMTFGSPLESGTVSGPPIFDTLMVAYLLPAIVLGGVAWKFDHLAKWLRMIAGVGAVISTTVYVGLEIRRLWQGRDLTAYGVMDGELYSYTIAMLLTGSVLLGLALMRKSSILRKAAVAVIALTIAKVFLIDMSGLDGLIRVFSFLALGLALAGLALLNRWVSNALEEE